MPSSKVHFDHKKKGPTWALIMITNLSLNYSVMIETFTIPFSRFATTSHLPLRFRTGRLNTLVSPIVPHSTSPSISLLSINASSGTSFSNVLVWICPFLGPPILLLADSDTPAVPSSRFTSNLVESVPRALEADTSITFSSAAEAQIEARSVVITMNDFIGPPITNFVWPEYMGFKIERSESEKK